MLKIKLSQSIPNPLQLNIECMPGELHALVGPSGSGKTTALRTIAGLNHAESGKIECDGEFYHRDKSKDAARDAKLREAGWSVYRITGKDCRDGVDSDQPSKSAARQFVQRIASLHNIQRAH